MHERQVKQSELIGDFRLILHTPYAQSLFKGKWKENKIGLIEFASLMNGLWKAVKEGDPYAEWYLMQAYEQIQELLKSTQMLEAYCHEKIGQLRGIQVNVFEHPNPIALPLTFNTPFGYMGANLLANFDYAARQAYTMKRLGIMIDEDHLPKNIIQGIKKLFSFSMRWRYTGVTREDIQQNNQKALLAEGKMGKIPEQILNKKIQFFYLPKPYQVEKHYKAA